MYHFSAVNTFFELGFSVLHVLENGFFYRDVAREALYDLVAKFPHQGCDALLCAVEATRVPDEPHEREDLREQLLALLRRAGVQRGARLLEDGQKLQTLHGFLISFHDLLLQRQKQCEVG